jgi:hypothetical protein
MQARQQLSEGGDHVLGVCRCALRIRSSSSRALAWNLAMRLPNVAARSSRQMTCRRAIRHNSSVERSARSDPFARRRPTRTPRRRTGRPSRAARPQAARKAATLTKFKQHLAHLAWLDGLGPARAWLAGIPPPKVAQFAGEAHVTDVADLRKMGAARRLALVVRLLHQAQVRARDEVATMFCKRMAAITKKAKEPTCPARGSATPLVISWDFGFV